MLQAFSNKLDVHGLAVESARSHWVELTEHCEFRKAWEALLNGFPGFQAALVSCRIDSMQGHQSGWHTAEHIVSHGAQKGRKCVVQNVLVRNWMSTIRNNAAINIV
jgi:hypothetical protein